MRNVLGFCKQFVHWREFFKSLQARGLHGVELSTSDAHSGLAESLKASFFCHALAMLPVSLVAHCIGARPKVGMKGDLMEWNAPKCCTRGYERQVGVTLLVRFSAKLLECQGNDFDSDTKKNV